MKLKSKLYFTPAFLSAVLVLTGCVSQEEPIIENQVTIVSEDRESAEKLGNISDADFTSLMKASEVLLLAHSYGMEVPNPTDIETEEQYNVFLYKLLSLSKEAYPYLASQISENTSPYDILLPYIDVYSRMTGDKLDLKNWFLNSYIKELGRTGYSESISSYEEDWRNRLGYSASALKSLAYGYGIELSDPDYDSKLIRSREDYLEYLDYLVALSSEYYPALSGMLSREVNVDSIMRPYEMYFDSMNDPSDEKTDWRNTGRLYGYMTDASRPLPSLYEVQEDFERDLAEAARAIKCIFGLESC